MRDALGVALRLLDAQRRNVREHVANRHEERDVGIDEESAAGAFNLVRVRMVDEVEQLLEAVYAELAVDVLDVGVHGVLRHAQDLP